MTKPRGAGLRGSKPVSRILSWVTILLCGYPAPRRAASTEPVRLAPDGVWRAAVSPRRWWALTPPFHPYRRRLRRCAAGGLLSVPLSVGFRRLPLGSVLPCGVRTFLDAAHATPRSPGLQIQFYLRARRIGSTVQDELALGAADARALVQHELPADRALERGAAQERQQLLLERPVQGSDAGHARPGTGRAGTCAPRRAPSSLRTTAPGTLRRPCRAP